MNKVYKYFRNHKVALWTLLGVTLSGFLLFGLQCPLEENIMKLLPSMESSTNIQLSFANLKVKDKMFVQVASREGKNLSQEELADIMDELMQKAIDADSATHYIGSTLYEVDPSLMLEAGTYLVEHAPAYLDFTEEEMDSLTSEQHIQETIELYLQIMETPAGDQLYDLLTYDPCGIVLAKTPLSGFIPGNMSGEGGDEGEEEDKGNLMKRFNGSHIFAGEGKACIGFITPAIAPNETAIAGRFIRRMNKIKDEVEAAHPDVEILWHGTIPQAAGNSGRIKADLAETILLSLLIIAILLLICFKRWRYITLMLLPIIYGTFFSLSVVYLVRGSMSLMALGVGTIVLGVALSYCLHLIIHYIYTGNASETIRIQAKPVLMGSLTTIGAFVGLMFTQAALLKDFGMFASLAIVGTTVASLIFMPHLFPRNHEPNKKAFAFLERANSIELDKRWWACALVLIFCTVCICFSGKYEFDNDLHNINYLSEFTQRSQKQWADFNDDGYKQQYYAASADNLDDALDHLKAMEDACEQLQKEGLVKKYNHYSVMLPSTRVQEERIDHWAQYFSEAKQAEVWHSVCKVCKNVEIEPELFDNFRTAMAAPQEPELIYESGVVPEEISCNFIEEVDGQWLVFLPVKTEKEDVYKAMDELDKVPGCIVLDPFHYTTSLVEMVHEDFNRIMLISSIFVFLLLLISYRNLWLAIIAFLPMMISWYTVLGAMALFHQSFNMINIIISSFIFGIGVDYSIFIMDGLIKRQEGGQEDKTIVYHRTAITISGTVLCICMFSLLFASHPALRSISFASLVGMITTIMLSYTIQPNLFRLYIKIKEKRAGK